MKLNEYIRHLTGAKRFAMHMSAEFMYIRSIPVWDLQIDTLEEQPEEFQERLLKLINRKRKCSLATNKEKVR